MYGIVVCPKCMQIQGIKIEGNVSYGCNGCGRRHEISKIKPSTAGFSRFNKTSVPCDIVKWNDVLGLKGLG